jgi:hypothetical protein
MTTDSSGNQLAIAPYAKEPACVDKGTCSDCLRVLHASATVRCVQLTIPGMASGALSLHVTIFGILVDGSRFRTLLQYSMTRVSAVHADSWNQTLRYI